MSNWIIALPREDMDRCIELGCFGREKLGDRISEVKEGDGVACYVLKESRIVALGHVTRGYYTDDTPKFLKEGIFLHRFDFNAEYLHGQSVSIGPITSQLTSIPTGGNFGLVVKSGFRTFTTEDWNLICDQAGRLDLATGEISARIKRPRWWWVNQGRTYSVERKGGYIWAPQKSKSGQEVFHHANVSVVRQGDIIWHYVDGRIVAVSTAESNATSAEMPDELPSGVWHQNGWMVRLKYIDLEQPVSRDDIPGNVRQLLGNESKSPMNKSGAVNQGYLFALPDAIVEEICAHFPQLVPPGVEPSAEVFNNDGAALEKFLELLKRLRVNRENGVPRLYKPATVLAVLDAIDTNELTRNEIKFDWLVPKFISVLERYGITGSEREAAMAFYHLQSEPFWQLKVGAESTVGVRAEPASLRNGVLHAELSEPYWNLLQHKSSRETIKEFLISYWFGMGRNDGSNQVFTYSAAIEALIQAIDSRGFHFEPWQIACFVTAIRTKPFVILAGISGSGKSQLPFLVSSITNGAFELIPVKPDWTDSTDVLGYTQLNGKFSPGRFLVCAENAAKNSESFHICVIDEMNLARVEHYFAEILSRLEQFRADPTAPCELVSHGLSGSDRHWSKVSLSSNLAIVGTVNMDESTHGFSKKVLDRAFTLEFSEIDLESWESRKSKASTSVYWPAWAWQSRAVQLSELEDISDEERDLVRRVVKHLQQLNTYLSQAQLQIAYRSRDEIALFVLHANDLLEAFRTRDSTIKIDPLDLAIQMKVLPRINGGSGPIRKLVLDILGWSFRGTPFASEDDAKPVLDLWRKQGKLNRIDGESVLYPRTCARLCLMWERILQEGFTSFWL